MTTDSPKRGKKFLYYLKKMEKEECIAFGDYLRSPLLGNSQHFYDLFSECLKQRECDFLDMEPIHQVLFPKKTWNSARENYLYLRLTQLLEQLYDYFALQAYQRDEQGKQRYLLSELVVQGWDHYLESSYKKGKKRMGKGISGAGLRHQLEIESILNGYYSNITVDGQNTHLEEVHQSLDHLYLLEKLKYGTASVNAGLVFGRKVELRMMEQVKEEVEQLSNLLPESILAYAQAFSMLEKLAQNPEAAQLHYLRLKNLLDSAKTLEKKEALDLYTYALNFCTVRWHSQASGYDESILELYDALLDKGLLLENKELPPRYYKNIVAVALRFGKLDWARQFTEGYRGKVAGDERELAYRYNLAVVHFHEKDYGGTVRLLFNEIGEYEDDLFGIGARIYLCRALWEQEEWEWLRQTLSAFRLYLNRNKSLVEREGKLYLNYVATLSRVVRVITGNPDLLQKKLEKIGKDLENAPATDLFRALKEMVRSRQ